MTVISAIRVTIVGLFVMVFVLFRLNSQMIDSLYTTAASSTLPFSNFILLLFSGIGIVVAIMLINSIRNALSSPKESSITFNTGRKNVFGEGRDRGGAFQ